jgi:hypothetical protein
MEIRFVKFLLIYLLGIGLFLSATLTLAANNPSIEITLNPAKPTPKSVVTISADIIGDSISTVHLIINECNKVENICHPPRNISMNKVDDTTYKTDVKLEYDDATSITYHIAVNSDGKWTNSDEYITYLSINSDKNGDDSNGSPGFEAVIFLISLTCVLFLFKKFKSK